MSKPLNDMKWIVVCLSMLVCTGCMSMLTGYRIPVCCSGESAFQLKNAERKNRKRYLEIANSYKIAADQGDLAGLMLLAPEYFHTQGAFGYDIEKGMALLERAAANHYGAAEYMLGLILLDSIPKSYAPPMPPNFYTLADIEVQPEPQRGIELLKRAASRACSYDMPMPVIELNDPVGPIVYHYASGAKVEKDKRQADVWTARGIIHCNKYRGTPHNAYYILLDHFPAIREGSGLSNKEEKALVQAAPVEQQTDALTWTLLSPDGTKFKSELISWLTRADRVEAERRSTELRRAVAESERDYPAPSFPTFRIHVGKPSAE